MVNPKKRSAFKEHCIDILISLPVKKVSKIFFYFKIEQWSIQKTIYYYKTLLQGRNIDIFKSLPAEIEVETFYLKTDHSHTFNRQFSTQYYHELRAFQQIDRGSFLFEQFHLPSCFTSSEGISQNFQDNKKLKPRLPQNELLSFLNLDSSNPFGLNISFDQAATYFLFQSEIVFFQRMCRRGYCSFNRRYFPFKMAFAAREEIRRRREKERKMECWLQTKRIAFCHRQLLPLSLTTKSVLGSKAFNRTLS